METAVNKAVWKRAKQTYQYLQVTTLCPDVQTAKELDRLKEDFKINHKAALKRQIQCQVQDKFRDVGDLTAFQEIT